MMDKKYTHPYSYGYIRILLKKISKKRNYILFNKQLLLQKKYDFGHKAISHLLKKRKKGLYKRSLSTNEYLEYLAYS